MQALFTSRRNLPNIHRTPDAQDKRVSRRAYAPFGEIAAEHSWSLLHEPEDKGFIGERYDRAAALQYLNARYYDPKLH